MNEKLINTLKTSLSEAVPIEDAAPWRLVIHTAVGGAFAAGFEKGRETLLVVSSNGQRIWDCLSGQRTYRNRDDNGYDWEALEAIRLDGAGHIRVPMAGTDGGGLHRSTSDGWSVETIPLGWPTTFSILQPPSASIFFLDAMWQGAGKDASYHLVMKSLGMPVVFGFSPSGNTLVWMDSSDLRVWSREGSR
ncbi:hypothetical protein ACLBWS_14490 [Brucellaceae bacterium D45D]